MEQQPPQPDTPAWLLKQKLSECPVCGGAGRVTCKDCSGLGLLPRGGYSKKNPLNLNRAVGVFPLDSTASALCIMGCATSRCALTLQPKADYVVDTQSLLPCHTCCIHHVAHMI
jgi:hypothetical protein